MANLRFSKKNVAWVEEHPHLAVAAANLRGQAGMSERDIFHTMKRQLAEPRKQMVGGVERTIRTNPSYGDLRAAFAKYETGHFTFKGERDRRVGVHREKVGPFELKEEGEKRAYASYPSRFGEFQLLDGGDSAYHRKLKAQYSDSQRDRLKRQFVTSYLIRAETPAEEFRDPQAFIAWEESQSYEVTPPI